MPANGNGSPLASKPDQRAQISLDPGSIDQRRPQHDEVERGLIRSRGAERLFDRQLGAAIGIRRQRRVGGPQRRSRAALTLPSP